MYAEDILKSLEGMEDRFTSLASSECIPVIDYAVDGEAIILIVGKEEPYPLKDLIRRFRMDKGHEVRMMTKRARNVVGSLIAYNPLTNDSKFL